MVLSRIFLADVRMRHFHFIENRLLEVGVGRGDREPTDPSAITHQPFAPPHCRASISILSRLRSLHFHFSFFRLQTSDFRLRSPPHIDIGTSTAHSSSSSCHPIKIAQNLGTASAWVSKIPSWGLSSELTISRGFPRILLHYHLLGKTWARGLRNLKVRRPKRRETNNHMRQTLTPTLGGFEAHKCRATTSKTHSEYVAFKSYCVYASAHSKSKDRRRIITLYVWTQSCVWLLTCSWMVGLVMSSWRKQFTIFAASGKVWSVLSETHPMILSPSTAVWQQ